MSLIWLLILIGHPYLSGVWLDVAPRTDTKKTCLKEIGLYGQNMITILDSIVNVVGEIFMTI
jgi:hypothetical protein